MIPGQPSCFVHGVNHNRRPVVRGRVELKPRVGCTLKLATKDDNVIIERPTDAEILADRIEPAPGVLVPCPQRGRGGCARLCFYLST